MTNAPARVRNLAHAFERLLEGGTMTRGDLMAATGLSKATVARLVTELEEAGFVEERWIDPSEGPGRRASGLGVPRALGHVLGLSLGLRSSHAVALDLAGRTVGSRLEPTPEFSEGDDEVLSFSQVEWFLDFVSKIPLPVMVGELAGGEFVEDDTGAFELPAGYHIDSRSAEIDRLAKTHMKNNGGSYADAVRAAERNLSR